MLRLIIFIACLAVIADAQGHPESATVKITSPASGVVVHPGQAIELEVAVTGPYSVVGISESLGKLTPLERSLNAAPYVFRVQIPGGIEPQLYTITVELYDFGGRINSTVATDRITLDVEPPAPPRKLSVSAGHSGILPVGDILGLTVRGTFDDPGELSLDRSTLTTYEAEPRGIVSVNSVGAVSALAPGTAKVTARHQGLQSSVTITVTGDELRITAPAEGTVFHPGQEISVDVAASGGPFKDVWAELGVGAFATSTVQPYWFFLTVPASAKIGPTFIGAMGHTDATYVSSRVTIDIERTDAPQALSIEDDTGFRANIWVGGYGSIQVYGRYADNPRVDLTRSTLTTYETSSEGIISLEKDGQFKGLAAGSTILVIRHRNLSAAVKVTVQE